MERAIDFKQLQKALVKQQRPCWVDLDGGGDAKYIKKEEMLDLAEKTRAVYQAFGDLINT